MLRGGIKVMSTKQSRNAARNGMVAFASLIMGILVIPEATNRLMPIGGVTMPMARLAVIIMPK